MICFFAEGPDGPQYCAEHGKVWTRASVTKGLRTYARRYPESEPAAIIKGMISTTAIPNDEGCAALFFFYQGYAAKRDTTGAVFADGGDLTVHLLNALNVKKLNETAIDLIAQDVELFELFTGLPRALDERIDEVHAKQKERQEKFKAERQADIDMIYATAEQHADNPDLLDELLRKLVQMRAERPADDSVLGRHLIARTEPDANVVAMTPAVVH